MSGLLIIVVFPWNSCRVRIWVTWAAAPFRRWQFGSDFPFRPGESSYGKHPPFDNVNWRADRGRSSRGITNEPTILNADYVKLREHKKRDSVN